MALVTCKSFRVNGNEPEASPLHKRGLLNPLDQRGYTMEFDKLDKFTRSYLRTAIWSELNEGQPLDRTRNENDLSSKLLDWAAADCARFQELADEFISNEPDRNCDWEQAGHDFWLTRNGHGSGFWDGDWPMFGDALTELSERFGECSLYVGDDDQLYHFDG